MPKSPEQFKQQNISEEMTLERREELFGQFIADAQSELSKVSTPEELWDGKAELVEAIALSGDIDSAKREAGKIPLNEEYSEYASNAFTSIMSSLARESPEKAFELMPNILDEDGQTRALFEILKASANKWDLEKIQKLAVQIIQIPYAYYQIEAKLVVMEALASRGQIEVAREKAQQEPGPANQLRAYLLIYKSSQVSEDIEVARISAAKCEYQPWEGWLQIAEITRDSNDVAVARKEIAAIKDAVTKGRQTTHFRERALIELAKITGNAEDVRVAREAATAADTQPLLMEFIRSTRNDADIDLLRKSGKNPSEHFDALAAVAGITKQESDFRAAYEAAKNLRTIPKVASGEYLRARAFAELAQALFGKELRR